MTTGDTARRLLAEWRDRHKQAVNYIQDPVNGLTDVGEARQCGGRDVLARCIDELDALVRDSEGAQGCVEPTESLDVDHVHGGGKAAPTSQPAAGAGTPPAEQESLQARCEALGAAVVALGLQIGSQEQQRAKDYKEAVKRAGASVQRVLDAERLAKQALDISVLLSDAGIGSCMLPEGVRRLIEERDQLREMGASVPASQPTSNYYAKALDLVAETMVELSKPGREAEYPGRAPKLNAIIRNAAAALAGVLSPQPEKDKS